MRNDHIPQLANTGKQESGSSGQGKSFGTFTQACFTEITESASTRASPSAFGSGWCRTQGHSQEDEEKQKDKADTSTSLKGIDE